MATYYINADTGDDTTGDGSQGNPWLTVYKANTVTTNGDTIFCQNSTSSYDWETAVNFGGKDMTLLGESTQGCVFNFNGSQPNNNWRFGGGDVILENLTFTNVNNTSSQVGAFRMFSGGNGFMRFNNCIIHNISSTTDEGGLFWVWSGPNSIEFHRCLFYDIKAPDIIPTGNTAVILTLTSCTFYFDSTATLFTTMVDGYGGASAGSTTTNCIIQNNQGNTIGWQQPVTYTCYTGSVNLTSDPTNINADPLLIDPDNQNFNLSPSSPCIDAGTLI